MNDAQYVITGWVATFGVLGAYYGWIVVRTRRAQRSLAPGETEPRP